MQTSLVIGPFRSDGYQFVMGMSGSVHAGCRVFTDMTQARKHWRDRRRGTPLGDETLRILDFIEREYQYRKATQ